ncbi:hypothetical protein NL154_04630 [Rhizobium sp. YTUHZ044]|uniref:hypothetical protein n=1 Tax=Rhizobium sp. YTUHZ044 TaxID=2962678 RepID=UPI003DA888C9
MTLIPVASGSRHRSVPAARAIENKRCRYRSAAAEVAGKRGQSLPSKSTIWNAIAGNIFETDLHFTPSNDGELTSAASALEETALGQHRPMLQARDGDSQDYRLPGSRLPLPRQMPGNFAEKIGGGSGSRPSASKEQPPICKLSDSVVSTRPVPLDLAQCSMPGMAQGQGPTVNQYEA